MGGGAMGGGGYGGGMGVGGYGSGSGGYAGERRPMPAAREASYNGSGPPLPSREASLSMGNGRGDGRGGGGVGGVGVGGERGPGCAAPGLLPKSMSVSSSGGTAPTLDRTPSAGGNGAGGASGASFLSAPPLSAQSSMAHEANVAAVEALLPKEEARILRLDEDGKRLGNELVELRFQHCLLEDRALALERELDELGGLLAKSMSDRAHLDENGTLPPPSMMPDEAAHAAAATQPPR